MRRTKAQEAEGILLFINSVWVSTFLDEEKNNRYIITIDSDIEEEDKAKVLTALKLLKEDEALVELEWFDLAIEPREWLEF